MRFSWILNQQKMQIRGSFVFLAFCVVMVYLITRGAFDKEIAANLGSMAVVIGTVGGLIGGIWKISPIIDSKYPEVKCDVDKTPN